MNLDGKWPYIAGGGLLLLLLILSRSGGSVGGSSTLVPIPTGSAGDDAVKLQHESNSGAILGALVQGATALTGQVNGYRGAVDVTTAQYQGESMLATVNGRTQAALASIGAGRDVSLAKVQLQGLQDSNATARAVSQQQTDSANTVAKAGARAQTNSSFWGAAASIGGAVLKFLF
jgi:hypothetical protein